MTAVSGLPAGCRVAWDDRVRLFGDASVVLGGAPWGVLRIAAAGRPFVRRLHAAGATGLVPAPGVESAVAQLLVRRGVAHPIPVAGPTAQAGVGGVGVGGVGVGGVGVGGVGVGAGVEVVVPAYENPELLDACLRSLRAATPGVRIVVVDDASRTDAVGEVALAHGATLIRHPDNRGPAAARNTGLREVNSALVAFVDADCAVTSGWLDALIGHFDDPRVAAVAPRISPSPVSGTAGLLARFEAARSALDMGGRPQLVTHNAPLGFLPSAALVVRRRCLGTEPFDERLRLGEDVDLIWRLVDDGHAVRYDPAAVVTHEMRTRPRHWAGRLFDYGTSAAELDRRHPGRLAPARLSLWNLTVAAALLARRPSPGLRAAAALGVTAVATGMLGRTLRAAGVDARVAPVIVAKGLLADAAAAGHLLRREWWPIGWLTLACLGRSRPARAAAAAMLVPLAREWLSDRPQVDPPRYVALRLTADAAYGSGVIAAGVRLRRPRTLLPVVRLPWATWPARRAANGGRRSASHHGVRPPSP